MTQPRRGRLARRLTGALALLLALWALLAAGVAWRASSQQERLALQRLSHGLAAHIVDHWPELARGTPSPPAGDRAARDELLRMLMTVNPGIQVYLLDADGRVDAYIGEPGMVRAPQVDLDAVRRFLRGDALPIDGSDPMDAGARRVFSAAMFPPRPGDTRPPGYLYVVLEGPARSQVARTLGHADTWRHGAALAAGGLLVTGIAGVGLLRRLVRPLEQLAQRMHRFGLNGESGDAAGGEAGDAGAAPRTGDEVAAIAQAFDTMALRVQRQADEQARQAALHREVLAGVAHDLRTPLTALHGHLEALGTPTLAAGARERHTATALAQSDKLRRLTQQLFELATLQAIDQPPHAERVRLDELVADAVQKFDVLAPPQRVALAGGAPGAIELQGDGQLIERALTNLIDNAMRHASLQQPVQVSLVVDEREVSVMVEDRGPGLPDELARRLNAGEPVRGSALRSAARSGSGGGLGLAIAQRIAALHGGRLLSLPAPGHGGARLCLALPRPPS